MKCSFIVPGYKCDEYIFRNIDSILDQDYKNYEIIPVLNGEWETKAELAKKLKEKYGDKINLHLRDVGGLGRANNYGTEQATGDIVSCLSSDLYLMPGALRTWIDAFEEHPDCDFVYSGYKFVSRNPLDVYLSNKYDRYHLECENFIDGANPVRRKAVARWNEEFKSLIDWDYFLSVTENGAKGYYIKEPLYYAEFPKVGGLSDDSSTNWVSRCKQIRAKHNIPDRPICITSLIDPDYGLELAKLANADFKNYPGHKPHDYRLIYIYGFFCDLDNIQKSTGVFFQHFGHKVIQWIGQDIISLIQLRWYDVNLYADSVLNKIKNHYCFNNQDLSVLDKLRITGEIVYPPIVVGDILERKKAISVNEPGLLEQLKKAMPDYEIVSNDLNCEITVHYGDRPDIVFKSILMGNHVISNTYYPGTYHVQGFTNVPELRRMVSHTIRSIKRNKVEPKKDDIEYYRHRTTPAGFKTKLERISEKKVQKYGRLEEQAHA